MKSTCLSLFAGLLLTLAPGTYADKLLIDIIEDSPPNTASGLSRPIRGQSMDQVRSQFGEPVERLPPVGQPPITRWVYPQYTVYFEYQTVLRSVVKHPSR